MQWVDSRWEGLGYVGMQPTSPKPTAAQPSAAQHSLPGQSQVGVTRAAAGSNTVMGSPLATLQLQLPLLLLGRWLVSIGASNMIWY